MTAAELKTLREALGLTTQWLADQAGVGLRTAQYWENGGRMAVPDDVAALIYGIDDQLDAVVYEAIAHAEAISSKKRTPEKVVLVRYRKDEDFWSFRPDMRPLPKTTHATLLFRIWRALSLRNIPTIIEYMEPDIYRTWLGKRKDTESMRAEWAAGQHQ